MRTITRRRAVGLVLASAATGAIAYGDACPIDKTGAFFTGKTKVEMGVLLKLYRCSMGHEFWKAS